MYIRDFQWDSGNEDHLVKHAVRPEEAEEACLRARTFLHGRHGRYAAYGQSDEGRYVVVIFISLGKGLIRIISARDMEARERQWYAKR